MMSHSQYIYDKYDCHIGIVYVVKELRAETFFAIKFKICHVIKAQLNSLSSEVVSFWGLSQLMVWRVKECVIKLHSIDQQAESS